MNQYEKVKISIDSIIEALTWKEDTHVINDFGEHVWLGPCYLDGKRYGITDCCMFDNPCDWHKELALRI